MRHIRLLVAVSVLGVLIGLLRLQAGVTTLSLAGPASDEVETTMATDGHGFSYQIPEAGAVPNSPPSASNALLGPSGATTSSTLTLSYSYSDSTTTKNPVP